MLTLKQFDALEVGDTFDYGQVLGGVIEEAVAWQVAEVARCVEEPGRRVRFELTYLGVFLGGVEAVGRNGTIQWGPLE